MKIRARIDAWQTMDPDQEALVALLKVGGIAEVLAIEEVGDHEGHAQLEIDEDELDDEEPVAAETEPV